METEQTEDSLIIRLTKNITDEEMEWLLKKYLSTRVAAPITRSQVIMRQIQKLVVAERL